MQILKALAVAALGVAAWKAWQRHQAGLQAASMRDLGTIIPTDGDPVLDGAWSDMEPPRAAAQSSRGFGD